MTTEIDMGAFQAALDEPGILLVDFWAPWCAPCRAFAPVFDAASKRHLDVKFAKVNTDAQPVLAGSVGIRAIPTLMAFRDGYMVFERSGMLAAGALDELIQRIRALDMAQIKRDIDAADAEHRAEAP